ncbi:MAG: enoyl-CoA hydratase [Ilumatobacter sp.]|uniref:enoyl-CoA hydratase n=1 Tax=Ilumatobacter sp. TaxID=1967498 RepID=UPI00262D1A6B|nr:enoyl-CoA hydratase [Ilumatobacter sp.]MDJ0771359.1 enoyl-CoA hydratase [Ilumatobacter sp.]
MSSAVLYEVDDRVAVITLNRPDRLNAWSPDLHRGYFASLDRAAADPDVRVIVVTGAGRGFCAGADMDALQAIGEGADVHGRPGPDRTTWHHAHAMSIPKPVIAAINGACAGLGFVHALACDIRFAAEGAKFTAAFSRRGLIAEHGSSWTLPRLVGQSVALDIMLSGRIFLAEEAKELGVVNRVVAPERLMDETLAYARDLAVNVSPTSMAVMKQQLYTHPMMSIDAALAESNRLMEESVLRPDFKEGVASFLERREPSFAPYGE